jgi:hypothetical protein
MFETGRDGDQQLAQLETLFAQFGRSRPPDRRVIHGRSLTGPARLARILHRIGANPPGELTMKKMIAAAGVVATMAIAAVAVAQPVPWSARSGRRRQRGPGRMMQMTPEDRCHDGCAYRRPEGHAAPDPSTRKALAGH